MSNKSLILSKSVRQRITSSEASPARKLVPTQIEKKKSRAPDHWRREQASFHAALNLHMRRCGDTTESLIHAAAMAGQKISGQSIRDWVRGLHAPRWHKTLEFLDWLDRRYGLPKRYFREKLFGTSNSPLNLALKDRNNPSQALLRWHLPEDFNLRSAEDQREILQWIDKNILPGSTNYGKYLRQMADRPYAVRFPALFGKRKRKYFRTTKWANDAQVADAPERVSVVNTNVIEAPQGLSAEMVDFYHFKTSTLSPPGFRRFMRWSVATAELRVQHYSLLFGALAAHPNSDISGLGIPPARLSFGLLTFPALWEWYLDWCRKRRGFHGQTECLLVQDLQSLTHRRTGWLRQHPEFAKVLRPLSGLISQKDILVARRIWDEHCERTNQYAKDRARELKQVTQVHRDPFAPILPILDAVSPLAEYRKIADEVLRQMPDEALHPKAAAIGIRSYLLLRFGMHLGLRQRNLRSLLVCLRKHEPKSARQLEELACGEIRWCERDNGWEVFIPVNGFKNRNSTFFSRKPFRVLLPNLDNLYSIIEGYLQRHRPLLLGTCEDPGTFFVRGVKSSRSSAAYTMSEFYNAWRKIIQHYGIYNPYTGRGALEGIQPHGPHSVRDVLATHILKQTGSFDLAAYAIQDTARTVAEHYARFLPQDKSAQAMEILNRVWGADGTHMNAPLALQTDFPIKPAFQSLKSGKRRIIAPV